MLKKPPLSLPSEIKERKSLTLMSEIVSLFDFVKENFTGKKSVKEDAPGEVPATAPVLPPHPEDRVQNSKQSF